MTINELNRRLAWRVTATRAEPTVLLASTLALGVVAISFWIAWWSGSWQVTGGDYSMDYVPALNPLLSGHLDAFFANLPTNGAGGSLLLRAPFALFAKLLVGGPLATFRLGTLACLLALGGLGLWLSEDMRKRGRALTTRVGIVALYAGAPALLEAVYYGHPEEPLGAAMCIAAVLAAGAKRPWFAGALLGMAVINKPWGVLAIAPVMLCVTGKQQAKVLLSAGMIAGCWFLSFAVVAPARFAQAIHGAETGLVAHPQNLWWPLAHTVGVYPLPPEIVSAHARQLAVAVALLAAAMLALRVYRSRQPVSIQQALALLTFGFALRCLLEPAPHDYYELPLVVALAAWEERARGSITISLITMIGLSLDFRRINELPSAIPYALYLLILLPIFALLVADLLKNPRVRAVEPVMLS